MNIKGAIEKETIQKKKFESPIQWKGHKTNYKQHQSQSSGNPICGHTIEKPWQTYLWPYNRKALATLIVAIQSQSPGNPNCGHKIAKPWQP